MKFINKLLRDEKGATAIEYGLIAALIAVAAITAMSSLGDNLNTTFNSVSDELSAANSSVSAQFAKRKAAGETPPLFFCARQKWWIGVVPSLP